MQTVQSRRAKLALFAGLSIGAAAWLLPREASALNGGVEYGIVKRHAESPHDFKLGTGWSAHLELSPLRFLNIGPYYLHYELASPSREAGSKDTLFDTLGLRARIFLPRPSAHLIPYAYAGIGYTWVRYPSYPIALEVSNPAMRMGGIETKSGQFYEIPIGVGIAYELARILHASLDFALRPATGFGGTAYEEPSRYGEPAWGFSLMLGASLNF